MGKEFDKEVKKYLPKLRKLQRDFFESNYPDTDLIITIRKTAITACCYVEGEVNLEKEFRLYKWYDSFKDDLAKKSFDQFNKYVQSIVERMNKKYNV